MLVHGFTADIFSRFGSYEVPMNVTLYSHPLSSYCWKVLIALYENGISFDARTVNLGDPEHHIRFLNVVRSRRK